MHPIHRSKSATQIRFYFSIKPCHRWIIHISKLLIIYTADEKFFIWVLGPREVRSTWGSFTIYCIYLLFVGVPRRGKYCMHFVQLRDSWISRENGNILLNVGAKRSIAVAKSQRKINKISLSISVQYAIYFESDLSFSVWVHFDSILFF